MCWAHFRKDWRRKWGVAYLKTPQPTFGSPSIRPSSLELGAEAGRAWERSPTSQVAFLPGQPLRWEAVCKVPGLLLGSPNRTEGCWDLAWDWSAPLGSVALHRPLAKRSASGRQSSAHRDIPPVSAPRHELQIYIR